MKRSLSQSLLLVATSAICAPLAIAASPANQDLLVDLPLKKNLGHRVLKQQWWSKNFLISAFLEEEQTGDPFNFTHSHWLKREDRHDGDVVFLQTPEDTNFVCSRDAIIWAFTTPPWVLRQLQNGRKLMVPEEGKGQLYRCNDFRTWKRIASFPLPRNGYLGLCEVLDRDRFLIYARCAATNFKNEYGIASINSTGELQVDEILKTSELVCSLENGAYHHALFHNVTRTQDHIILSYAQEGWLLVFDAHTGAFCRVVRCYEEPREDVPKSGGFLPKVLLSLLPMPDGRFLMASKNRDFARLCEAPGEGPDPLHKIRLVQSSRTDFPDREVELLKLRKIMSDLVWRSLDAGSGVMQSLEPPIVGGQKLTSSDDVFDFSVCFKPNEGLRILEGSSKKD
jgi:hypothetical protein